MQNFNKTFFVFSLIATSIIFSSCGSNDNADGSSAANGSSGPSREQTEEEYRLIKAELKLAEVKKPYFVLNFRDTTLEFRLNGAVVWEYPMAFLDSDKPDLKEFAEDFLGSKNTLVRPIVEKHLFSALDKTPDSVLAIISEATNVKAQLMQREVPARFQLIWGGGLTIDVRTDVQGKPRSKIQNTLTELQQAITRPLGRSILVLRMQEEQALTLYRATIPGLPTLVIPS